MLTEVRYKHRAQFEGGGGGGIDIHILSLVHLCNVRTLYVHVAVTSRKRTLFHCKWLVISLECFIEITPDFLCPFMND